MSYRQDVIFGKISEANDQKYNNFDFLIRSVINTNKRILVKFGKNCESF